MAQQWIVAGRVKKGWLALMTAALALTLALTLTGCGSSSSKSSGDDAAAQNAETEQQADAQAAEEEPKEIDVTIDSCKKTKDYEGKAAILVTYTFKNNSEDAKSFMSTVSASAFQGGVELSSAILAKDIDSENTMKEIKPGASIEVQMAYELEDNSEVTIEVEPLFSFGDEMIATKSFKVK